MLYCHKSEEIVVVLFFFKFTDNSLLKFGKKGVSHNP